MTTPGELVRRRSAEWILDAITRDDPELRLWTRSDWYSLAEGANSAGGSRRSSIWYRISALASMRSRDDETEPRDGELSSRVGIISIDGAGTDELADPSFIYKWARARLDGWTPELVAKALSQPTPETIDHVRAAHRAAAARDLLRRLALAMELPSDLSIWTTDTALAPPE